MKKTTFYSKILQGLGLMAVLSATLIAAAPTFINYQGKLTDGQGASVEGEIPVKFSFYNAEEGGTEIHNYSTTVTPSGGVFSALIPVPGDLFISNTTLYLGINVNSSGEFTSRQQLVAAPYALAVAAGSVGVNELAPNMVLPNTVVASSLSPSVMINADQINAGTLPTNVVASSITAEVKIDPATQIKDGTLPTTVVASSLSPSVTINADQIAPGGTLPALDGSQLTGLGPTEIGVDAIDTLQIKDNAVTNDKITGMSASKLTGISNVYETSDGRLILGANYKTSLCGIGLTGEALFYGCDGNCDLTAQTSCTATEIKGKIIP